MLSIWCWTGFARGPHTWRGTGRGKIEGSLQELLTGQKVPLSSALPGTHAVLMRSASLQSCYASRWGQIIAVLIFNKEFPGSASHQLVLTDCLPALCTHRRRSYRLSDPVNYSD